MPSLKLAFRTLAKSPFVTLVAILSLALGIGANAAIYSLFDQIVLRQIPVASPDELVNLGAPGPKPGSQSCGDAGGCDAVFSYPMFRDLEQDPGPFSGIAAHRSFGANLSFRGQTTNSLGTQVSGGYFSVLGLTPAIGRLLGPEDDHTEGSHFVAVLSHWYWTDRFGANPDVLDETLIVNGQSMTIIGVAPQGFNGTTLGQRPAVFVPISMRAQMFPGWDDFENRKSYWVYLFARLESGMTMERARVAINVPYHAIVNEVEVPLQDEMSDTSMERFRAKEMTVEAGDRGQSSMHGEAFAPLLLLLVVTGIVLLIACANIANLLLARATSRGTELAVRLSIGASRRHVVSQLLTESVLLGLLGGVGGLVAARWTLSLIVSQLPPEAIESFQAGLDWRVVGFAGALSIGAGLVFGLFPALHSTRPDIITALRAQSGVASGARSAGRFRTALATGQIALSMALLISAGLFVKSLVHVSRIELGVQTDNMATFRISPELNGYQPESSRALFARVEEELLAQPGIGGVASSRVGLLAGSSWGNNVTVEGFEAGLDTDTNSRFNAVGPGYFQMMGVPLLSGREFTDRDVLESPKVAIVNQAFAEKFGLGREAVGKWMTTGRSDDLDIQIVGLVQNAKYAEVKDVVPPLFYLPHRQNDSIGTLNFYVRSSIGVERTFATIRETMAGLDSNLPVVDLKTMDDQVRESIVVDRIIGTLSAAFASLATLLAAVGLYGVLAYTTAQRTREIGLRMALGADGRSVRAMVLAQVGRMTLVGGVIGVVAAIGLGRAAGSLLYELQAHDPGVMVVSVVLLAVVAGISGLIPALRASRINPIRALRYE